MYSSHHVLPADGTLVHFLATAGAGDHVTTLKQDTVDHSVHADTTHVFIHGAERSHTCTQTHNALGNELKNVRKVISGGMVECGLTWTVCVLFLLHHDYIFFIY